MARARTHEFLTLDALRGVAAIAVMIGHVKPFADPRLDAYSGYLAVDLFFVLSGFVLARAYGARLADGLSPLGFMALRVIRLWPLVFLGAAIGGLRIALLPLPRDDFASGFGVATVTMLNAVFLPGPPHAVRALFPANDPEWSLFYELVANLAFALGVWRLRGKFGAVALAACGVALVALGAHYHGVNAGFDSTQYPAGTVRVLFSFFLGVTLWRTRGWWQHRLPRVPASLLLIAAALLFFVPGEGTGRTLFDIAFVLFFSPLLILLGAVVQPGARWRSFGTWLGEMSFPLYAIHFPFARILDALIPAGAPGRAAAEIALIVALLGVCGPLARFYDAPMRAWLTRLARPLLDRRRPATA